ncbi:MAG TPA: hypothetical protein VIG48_05560 [Jatrophihabitans sp.]
MATIQRVEPVYTAWAPSASGFGEATTAAEDYVGKHRRPGARGLGLFAMFYRGRHRRH